MQEGPQEGMQEQVWPQASGWVAVLAEAVEMQGHGLVWQGSAEVLEVLQTLGLRGRWGIVPVQGKERNV